MLWSGEMWNSKFRMSAKTPGASITSPRGRIDLEVPKIQKSDRDPDVFEQARRLAEKTEKGREEMIRTELRVASTFCNLAPAEARAGNQEHLNKVVRDAWKAVEQIRKRLNEADVDGNQAILQQLREISEKLKTFGPEPGEVVS